VPTSHAPDGDSYTTEPTFHAFSLLAPGQGDRGSGASFTAGNPVAPLPPPRPAGPSSSPESAGNSGSNAQIGATAAGAAVNPASANVVALAGTAASVAVRIGNAGASALDGIGVALDGRPLFDGQSGHGLGASHSLALGGDRPADAPPGDRTPRPGAASLAGAAVAVAVAPRGEGDAQELEIPPPQPSGLITDLRIFDRASLEQAIDQFLQQCEDLGEGLSQLRGPSDWLGEFVAVTLALTAWKVVPKVLARSRRGEAELAGADVVSSLDGFSGLPGSWSPEEA
jgi:hypothetical protein